ncbi:MAG: hypothetical protein P1Q69_19915, partial [Candidatus Thorarchaeota archaeon]|nr:hypothetical protein [Candidatus Thorarchaeota archaeon]
AQNAMLHPLESVLYYVHGYYGSTDSWNPLDSELYERGVLLNYDHVERFDYAEYWLDAYPDCDIDDVHAQCTISSFAWRLAVDIENANYDPGTQIDIVAHSLGGIIARELLRVYRSELQNDHNIDFGRIITLGTPHEGTYLADGSIPSSLLVFLISVFNWGQNWDSPLLDYL